MATRVEAVKRVTPTNRRHLGIGLALVVAACAALPSPAPPNPAPTEPRPLGSGQRWLPTFLTVTSEGVPIACAGTAFEADLHGSAADPHLAWMIRPDGRRQELVWPLGYSARFDPALEVLDDRGQVVAREGSLVTGGCPMPPGDSMWVEFNPPQPPATPADLPHANSTPQ
jgi:hypothetical protein